MQVNEGIEKKEKKTAFHQEKKRAAKSQSREQKKQRKGNARKKKGIELTHFSFESSAREDGQSRDLENREKKKRAEGGHQFYLAPISRGFSFLGMRNDIKKEKAGSVGGA